MSEQDDAYANAAAAQARALLADRQGTPPEPDRDHWVVLAVNINRQALIVGNAYGRPIPNEKQALRLADRLEREHGIRWNFLVLPITSRKEWGQ